MLKNLRLFVSLFTSFTLVYSNYSFATDGNFLEGELKVTENPSLNQCSNDDIKGKGINFPFELIDREYFVTKDEFVDLKISDSIVNSDERYSIKDEEGIEFQWQAKCVGLGEVKYQYKKDGEEVWNEVDTSILIKKSEETIGDNKEHDDLFSYLSCAENFVYHYDKNNGEGGCYSNSGCVIKIDDLATYIKGYDNNETIEDKIIKHLPPELNMESNKVKLIKNYLLAAGDGKDTIGDYYGLIKDDATTKGVWSGQLEGKKINAGDTLEIKGGEELLFSAICEDRKDEDGQMFFKVRVIENNFFCSNQHLPYVAAVQVGSNSVSKLRNSKEYRKEGKNFDEYVLVAKSSTCQKIQCIVNEHTDTLLYRDSENCSCDSYSCTEEIVEGFFDRLFNAAKDSVEDGLSLAALAQQIPLLGEAAIAAVTFVTGGMFAPSSGTAAIFAIVVIGGLAYFLVQEIYGWDKGEVGETWNNYKDFTKNVGSTIVETASSVVETVVETASAVVETVVETASSVVETIVETASSVVDRIKFW
jgi:hypothetical protein